MMDVEITLDELAAKFQNLYPTEFAHSLAEAKADKLATMVSERDAELEELRNQEKGESDER